MKVSIILTALFVALVMPQNSFANGATTSKDKSRPVIIIGTGNRQQRPKAPSLQNIYCAYDGENLLIEFTKPEGVCILTLMDTSNNTSSQYSFDSSEEATIYIGDIDNASIVITTSEGNSYSGSII